MNDEGRPDAVPGADRDDVAGQAMSPERTPTTEAACDARPNRPDSLADGALPELDTDDLGVQGGE